MYCAKAVLYSMPSKAVSHLAASVSNPNVTVASAVPATLMAVIAPVPSTVVIVIVQSLVESAPFKLDPNTVNVSA